MSVLRKKEPLTTADIANPQRAGATRPNAVVDQDAFIDLDAADPAGRRPPRSAAAGNSAAYDAAAGDTAAPTAAYSTADESDDTYDGEIIETRVDSAPQSTASQSTASADAGRQNPNRQEFAYGRSASSAPVSKTVATESSDAQGSRENAPLFAEDELGDFRARWDQVQTSFVDEPRHAVEQADTLVATVVKRIAEQFAEERSKLEKQWDRGDNVSTEELRQGFKRYRAFFDRLLSF
jgi:hypothetical protein